MPTTTSAKSLRDSVLDAIPGYRQAEHRRHRLTQILGQLPAQPDLILGYQARIFAAADEGADNLNDLRLDYITDLTVAQGAMRFREEVVEAMHQAVTQMDTTRRQGASVALDYLRRELDSLMADVRKNRDIIATHPTNAADVINGGRSAKDWKLVEDLVTRYDTLRALHREYVKFQGNPGGTDFAVCGQVAKFLDTDPHWIHRRNTAHGNGSPVPEIREWFASRPARRTKAEDAGRSSIWPASMRPAEWLLTVADNRPWLPNAHSIEEAAHLANQLMDKPFKNGSTLNFFRDTLKKVSELTANGTPGATPRTKPAKPVAFTV